MFLDSKRHGMFNRFYLKCLQIGLLQPLRYFYSLSWSLSNLMTYWHCLLSMSPVELLNFYHPVWFPLLHFHKSDNSPFDYSIQKPSADPEFFSFLNFPYSSNWFCLQIATTHPDFYLQLCCHHLWAISFLSGYLNSHPTPISGLILSTPPPSPDSSKSDFLKKWKLDHFILQPKSPFIYALAFSSYRNTPRPFSS